MMKGVLNSRINMHRTSPKRSLYPVFNCIKNGGYTLNHSLSDAEKNRYCITT